MGFLTLILSLSTMRNGLLPSVPMVLKRISLEELLLSYLEMLFFAA